MSELTKERREKLRDRNDGLVCDGAVVNGVTVDDVCDLLDALDAMEAERDEARTWASDLRDRHWRSGSFPWEDDE